MSLPTFLKARSPPSLTKSATLASKPLTPKATVLAAIACAKVYSMSSTPTLVSFATEVSAFVYWTMTSSAETSARPEMPAEKEPLESSKPNCLPVPPLALLAKRPKRASFKLTWAASPAARRASMAVPTATSCSASPCVCVLKPKLPSSPTKPKTSIFRSARTSSSLPLLPSIVSSKTSSAPWPLRTSSSVRRP